MPKLAVRLTAIDFDSLLRIQRFRIIDAIYFIKNSKHQINLNFNDYTMHLNCATVPEHKISFLSTYSSLSLHLFAEYTLITSSHTENFGLTICQKYF